MVRGHEICTSNSSALREVSFAPATKSGHQIRKWRGATARAQSRRARAHQFLRIYAVEMHFEDYLEVNERIVNCSELELNAGARSSDQTPGLNNGLGNNRETNWKSAKDLHSSLATLPALIALPHLQSSPNIPPTLSASKVKPDPRRPLPFSAD